MSSRSDNKNNALANEVGHKGATDDLEQEWLIDRITGGVPPSRSPEAQAVIDRMSALTTAEEDAIEKYVDGCVVDGIYDQIIDVWCLVLNNTDRRIGFKQYAETWLTNGQVGTPTDLSGGVQFDLSEAYISADTVATIFTESNAGFLFYVHDLNVNTAANLDYFGQTGGVSDTYLRTRGDANGNDINSLFGTNAATPRPLFVGYLDNDICGWGFDDLEGWFISPGDIFEKMARTTPIYATVEWCFNGRNSAGSPQFTPISSTHAFWVMLEDIDAITQTEISFHRARALTLLTDLGLVTNAVWKPRRVIFAQQTPGGDTINDLWLQVFIMDGAVSGDFNDAAYEWLIIQGVTPAALPEMWNAYWISLIP